MAGLSTTLAGLARYRRQVEATLATSPRPARLSSTALPAAFGANPGALDMLTHVPAGLGPGAPLVVALHGCGQDAAQYSRGSGWATLADRFGFALLLPRQRPANNAGTCFNWFVADDITRGEGEAASVRAMIETMLTRFRLDRRRVFVTGLSAGGAFANVMLATYPELFAGGAIVAGLPYGAAHGVGAALDLMHRAPQRGGPAWGALLRAASPHAGPWPRISVWQGLADTTVSPANATSIVRQWLDVHGLAGADPASATLGAATRMTWRTAAGQVAVEHYALAGMGHGVPISAADADPAARCGAAGPFLIETGLSSSHVIAQSWGLTRTP